MVYKGLKSVVFEKKGMVVALVIPHYRFKNSATIGMDHPK